jgi:hypothetical protein
MQATCAVSAASRVCWESADLRLCGTLLSDGVYREILATLVEGAWRRKGTVCEPIEVHGPLRLLFGIPRHPARATRPFDRLTLKGALLEADGVAFARYVPESDMWRALERPMWWHSLHILTAGALALEEPTGSSCEARSARVRDEVGRAQ